MGLGLKRHIFAAVQASALAFASAFGAVANEGFQTALAEAAAPLAQPTSAEPLRTRFVAAVEKNIEISVQALRDPPRVIVDMDQTRLQLPDLAAAAGKGLVTSFRAGQSAPGKTRIVIELNQPVVVEGATVTPAKTGGPYKLMIDMVAAKTALSRGLGKGLKTKPSGLGAGGLQPPMPRPAVPPRARAARTFKPVIVIDPGHGGHDTGAMKFGTVEKEVVLAFSKVLRDKLEKSGRYRVLMTRDDDVFIPLGERVSFAERHKANLFIAVHADYASTKARGATIYSLRSGVASALRRSAKGDVTSNILTPDEINAVKEASGDVKTVRDILADLATREVDVTQERTSVFAKSVIETMGASTTLREEPEQFASFRVLKTAQFPSVLIELAYVTNREDAANLKSDTWRDKVSDSILSAVGNYFSHELAQLPM